MTFEEIYKFYRKRMSDIQAENEKAIKDYLRENGLSEDVYNPKGKRGRLIVCREYGEVTVKFYAYTNAGELSKLSGGSIYTWSANPFAGYRRADNDES